MGKEGGGGECVQVHYGSSLRPCHKGTHVQHLQRYVVEGVAVVKDGVADDRLGDHSRGVQHLGAGHRLCE